MASSTPDGARTTLDDVLEVLALAERAGVRLWLDGGWGVDALLGRQTREHGDLDVAVEGRHRDAFLQALAAAGFARAGEAAAKPWNFLMARPDGVVVDLHVIELDADGNGLLAPGSVYPAASLRGRAMLGGRPVDCITAEWVVKFHDEYAGDADDRADVRAVCERYDLEIPAQYR